MVSDKKSSQIRGLYNCLAFAMCLILGLPLAHAEIEFKNNPAGLFQTSKNEQCTLVNVHSIYKSADGKVLHQEGVGWVTYSQNYFGVITPYHVVVNAELVVAECRGQLFALETPTIDAEKDIAHFYFTNADVDRMKAYVTPLLLALRESDADLKRVFESQKPGAELLYLNFQRTHLDTELFGLMLAMGNFGVAGAINPATGNSTVIMSPARDDMVQPLIDSNQSYIRNLIRVENMGIRPGQSGSALFGVPDNGLFYTLQDNRRMLNAPLELIPKVIFGMITKTRLNGAETVALSIGDIYDFMEERVLKNFNPIGKRDLRVNYEPISTASGEQLRSSLSLHPQQLEEARVYEYCSGEYKNSAESGFTENKKLKALLEKKSPKTEDQHTLQGIYNNPANIGIKARSRIKDKNLQKSGGGEYGEGGDGFLSRESEFLTSQSPMGKFDVSLSIKTLKSAPSFGLYLAHNSCATRGLLLTDVTGKKLIHTVNLPGEKPLRMTSFEDLRHFNKKHKEKTLSLLKQFGRTDNKPFFTQELNEKEVLQIPLLTAQKFNSDDASWNANERKYLKQKLIIHPKASPTGSQDALQISKNSLKLAVNLSPFQKLQRAGFQDKLQLQYANNQWRASLAFGLSCRMELEPKYFKQVNPYYVEYNDGKNKLTIDLNSHDRFIAVNLIKSDCPELKDLALAEIEVYLIPALSAVIGTTRTALVPLPLDLEGLKKKYLLPAGGKK